MNAATDFNAITVPLSDGYSFILIHNLPLEGPGNIVEVLDEWVLLTYEFSAESFCLYLMDRRQRGLTDRVAMTKAQFEKKFQVAFGDYFAE